MDLVSPAIYKKFDDMMLPFFNNYKKDACAEQLCLLSGLLTYE